ncbi:MAG: LCP family protein [Acidimicrobiia bacterium]
MHHARRRRLQRVVNPQTSIFAIVTIVVFVFLLTLSTTPVLVVAAAVSAAVVGAAAVGVMSISSGTTLGGRMLVAHVLAGTIALLLGYGIVTGAQVWASWNDIDRKTFALHDARSALVDIDDTTTSTSSPSAEPVGQVTTTVGLPDEAFVTMLLIGGDADSGAGDVILYLVLPTNGADPFMMSFPRDLYVTNPCTRSKGRINTLVRGCPSKGINGGTLLAVQVSDMTGIDVDHFAEFTFEGFVDIIDAVGGIEICVDHAVRDPKASLDLPAGCTDANGAQALSWVRSRKTEEYRDGVWRSVPGRGDLMRNTHQQDVILQLAQRIKSFQTPKQLTDTVAALSDAFVLSDTLSLTDAIGLAWSVRDIDIASINRLEIPVRLSRSPTNQSILIATTEPSEIIAAQYGNQLPTEDP